MPTDYRESMNMNDWMRDIEKRLMRQERRQGIAQATITEGGDGTYIPPPAYAGAPPVVGGDPGPTAPPAASPAFTVDVLFKTLTVKTDPIDQYTTLLYEVASDAAFSTIVLAVSAKQTYIQLAPLPAATDLWVRVTASNELGAAAPAPASGPYRTILIQNADVADSVLTVQKFQNSVHLIY